MCVRVRAAFLFAVPAWYEREGHVLPVKARTHAPTSPLPFFLCLSPPSLFPVTGSPLAHHYSVFRRGFDVSRALVGVPRFLVLPSRLSWLRSSSFCLLWTSLPMCTAPPLSSPPPSPFPSHPVHLQRQMLGWGQVAHRHMHPWTHRDTLCRQPSRNKGK